VQELSSVHYGSRPQVQHQMARCQRIPLPMASIKFYGFDRSRSIKQGGLEDRPPRRLVLNKATEPYAAIDSKQPSIFPVGQKFPLEDIIEAQQFNSQSLSAIVEVAQKMEMI